MNDPDETPLRLERVRAVVAIGKRVSDPRDPLGRRARTELTDSSHLSREGVELALRNHLETDPSDDELSTLLERTRVATRCHVVLSAQVCVGALRALALGVASSRRVFVKPSRRDPVLARLFVRELRASGSFVSAGGEVHETSSLEVTAGDLVHAYGSDATLASLRASIPEGVELSGHGSGFGLAVVEPRDDLVAAATQLSEDVAPFDQRGCLSPRLALVGGDVTRARRFAGELDLALARIAREIPLGRLDADEVAERARYVEIMRATGEAFVGPSNVVGFDPDPEALWLGPACRVVHVVPMALESLQRLLSPLAPHVTSLGFAAEAGPLLGASRLVCAGARIAPLGRMQRPPLDGPVDLREVGRFSR